MSESYRLDRQRKEEWWNIGQGQKNENSKDSKIEVFKIKRKTARKERESSAKGEYWVELTLGRIREDAMAATLDDRGFRWVLTAVPRCFGWMSAGHFGWVLASLAWVWAPVVLSFTLLLQWQPAWHIIQLCSVGQVYQHLQHATEPAYTVLGLSFCAWMRLNNMADFPPLPRSHWRSTCHSPIHWPLMSSSSAKYMYTHRTENISYIHWTHLSR